MLELVIKIFFNLFILLDINYLLAYTDFSLDINYLFKLIRFLNIKV